MAKKERNKVGMRSRYESIVITKIDMYIFTVLIIHLNIEYVGILVIKICSCAFIRILTCFISSLPTLFRHPYIMVHFVKLFIHCFLAIEIPFVFNLPCMVLFHKCLTVVSGRDGTQTAISLLL